MKTFNKRGDGGETDLLYGGRIRKDSARTEAYGTIDEAVSALGIARALAPHNEALQLMILQFQRELFIIGAEMATEPSEYAKLVNNFAQVTPEMVGNLERLIEEYEDSVPDGFVIPGGSVLSAHLDLARTIVRRAERRCAGLWHERMLANEQLTRYLNRLADLLFVLARSEERGSTIMVKG